MERLRISVELGVHINQITEMSLDIHPDWFKTLERMREQSIFNRMIKEKLAKKTAEALCVPVDCLVSAPTTSYSEFAMKQKVMKIAE